MNKELHERSIPVRRVAVAFTLCILAVVAFSAFWSGFFYQLDLDEVNHLVRAYEVLRGRLPYRDFHSMYAPVLHWLLAPMIGVLGPTVQTVMTAKLFMVACFIGRVTFTFLILRQVYSRNVAVVFLCLYFMDPFTVFSGMQIRPDSLMMLLYTVGLYLTISSIRRRSRFGLLAAGVVMAFSVIVHTKVIISVSIMSLVLLAFLRMEKRSRSFQWYVIGAVGATGAYLSYFLATGTAGEMLRQTLLDPGRVLGAVWYPPHMGTFITHNNFIVYGLAGKPLTWWYIWFLPFMGVAGLALTVREQLLQTDVLSPQNRLRSMVTLGFAGAMSANFVLLLSLHTVFIQYYQAVMWYISIFGAVGLSLFLRRWRQIFPTRQWPLLALGGLFLVFAAGSIRSNFSRAGVSFTRALEQEQVLWQIIPENAPVYPRLLFRPLGHPLGTSQFYPELPEEIRSRYPEVSTHLDANRIPYVILSAYEMEKMGIEFRSHIMKNYSLHPGTSGLYVRKE